MNQASLSSRIEDLPLPLRIAPDMAARWRDTEEDFDVAASSIVEAHASDGRAEDVPVTDLRDWGVVPFSGRFSLAPVARNRTPIPLRSTAFTNLAAKLGAPAEFIRDRLPAPLQLATMNYLLATAREDLPATLRMRGDQVTAIVSSRYAPFDAVKLLDSVRTILRQQDLLHAVRARATATGLVDVVRLVIPSEMKAVKVGDVSAVGLDISTSSFGRSALHVRGLVWRLKCTNGLRVAKSNGSMSVRHIGDPGRLRNALAEAIPTAIARARGLMDAWQRAVAFMVEDVERQIDALRDLSLQEQRLVKDEATKEAGATSLPASLDLYTLTNGITAAARQLAPARRLEVEGLAAEFLTRKIRGAS